jgi:hypothetical protein
LVLYAVSSAKSVPTGADQSDEQVKKPASGVEIVGKLLTDTDQRSGAKSSRSRARKPKA